MRSFGKGGGLAIYVTTRVCADEENIKEFDPNPEPENSCGEFQFVKILNCKNYNKTIVLGNIYRSPSSKPDAFKDLMNFLRQFCKN